MKIPFSESYKIKMVEPLYKSTKEERQQWIKTARYNLFNLKSGQVYIDLLTDSGTGAMSNEQWSSIMLGDESYAGASSYYKLKEVIEVITGFQYFLPTHQGRAAENVLFSALLKEGDVVPGNSHFDTTKGHIEFRKARAVDCTIDEAFEPETIHPFKGNLDSEKLEAVINEYGTERIPLILITITNNTAGGQPVSLENIREVASIAKKHKIRLYFDAARFAENAFFIKTREKGQNDRSIRDICREIFSYGDGMTMSSKKDAIVNIGGFAAFRDQEAFEKSQVYNILFEGFNTYGGMAGRDMNALATGLYEGTEYNYLESRINQIKHLGQKIESYNIPFIKPVGGHAIFIDAGKFLHKVPKEEFIAQTLAVELYLEAGIRSVEIGTLLADRDPQTRQNRFPKMELLRLTIPRRVYTNNHMDVVAAALKNIYDRRNTIQRGLKIIKEAPILRHFTIELERIEETNH
jgi:tryptophanase